MYEEMEQQLAKERSEIRAEEERKDKKIQREFEMMIQIKDAQMQVHIHFKLLLCNDLLKVLVSSFFQVILSTSNAIPGSNNKWYQQGTFYVQ